MVSTKSRTAPTNPAPEPTDAELDAMTPDQLAAYVAHLDTQIAAAQRATAHRTCQRQADQEAAANAERAATQAAYDRDAATRQALFAKAEALTAELVGVVRETLDADARIYSASLALGIAGQRGGSYSRRFLEGVIGHQLNAAGLREFPRRQRQPIAYSTGLDGDDPAPIRDRFPVVVDRR